MKNSIKTLKQNGTILLVEDEQDDIFIFQRTLVAANVLNPVVVLTNGQAAIDYLSQQGAYSSTENPLPFLIFLDLKLPYLDGFEVLTWIRKQPELDKVVVVVLSGSDENRDHIKAYTLGARSYLLKPPNAQEIRQFMDSMASYWGEA